MFLVHPLCVERKTLRQSRRRRKRQTNDGEVSGAPLGGGGYLLRLRWASRSKLSKSRESYLLLVEAGSKSSEWESERGGKRTALRSVRSFLAWSTTNKRSRAFRFSVWFSSSSQLKVGIILIYLVPTWPPSVSAAQTHRYLRSR